MPKKSKSAPQPTLFRRDIPKMPDGYYSSGPNPNLHSFVEENAEPYDPVKDDYHVGPFTSSITIENRRNPINDLHIYWSKKPFEAIQTYIRHFTNSDDIVLDPFSGSGGTALAALMEGRKAIAIDLSPAATFITKNYCTPVDVDQLQLAFLKLTEKVKPEIDWLYETRCDRCDGKATIKGTVYSYVYQCPRCLNQIPFADTITIQILHHGINKEINTCPECYANGTVEEIDVEKCKKSPYIPVMVSYSCEEGCKPQRAERRYNDANPKKKQYFAKYDAKKIHEINEKNIPYWYPTARMLMSSKNQKAWGLLWRPYHGDIERVDQFFTKRNLYALALINAKIQTLLQNEIANALNFVFSGAIYNATIMYRQRDTGGGPQIGNYYVPPVFREVMAWTLIEQKIQNLIKAQGSFSFPKDGLALNISTQSATDVNQITSSSIDYIFTDPPYSSKVQYGELNFLWESWLKFDSSWLNREIIVNKVRGMGVEEWGDGLKLAMEECFRVLKPGRWLSLCYHDNSEGTWQFVQDIMTEVGFIPETSEKTLFIDTGQKTFHQFVDDQVTKRDLVINFRKPREGEIAAKVLLTGEEDPTSFSEKGQLILREVLNRHPGTSADHLYDELVSRMVRKGQFQRHNFDELLGTVAEETGGRWYLLETADQLDETESKKEDAAASQLEAFMQKYLKKQPDEIGVHYSNLFEEYLPIGDKPRRLLQDWLPEFFYKTEEGTWRPPINVEERQAKLSLRLTGELRHIKRFANALSAGVPTAERDRPSNAATLAEWIYQCRRSGMYDLGRILYERGGLRFDSLKEERQLQVEEDYQICVKRGSLVDNKVRKTKKKVQPSLFDEADQ